MVAEPMTGYAIDVDWEFPLSGATSFAYLKYLPEGPGEPPGPPGEEIPGFGIVALLAVALVTTAGIGYSMKRKKKRA